MQATGTQGMCTRACVPTERPGPGTWRALVRTPAGEWRDVPVKPMLHSGWLQVDGALRPPSGPNREYLNSYRLLGGADA